MAEKKIEEIKIAKLKEVTTQTGLVIELPDGTIVNELELLVILYNKITNLEKVLA